jgi:hypothetical protein
LSGFWVISKNSDILGEIVTKTAKWTKDDIHRIIGGTDKASYLRAVRDNHPDVGGTHARMCEITEAWQMLQKGTFRKDEPGQTGQTGAGWTRTNPTNQDRTSEWERFWAQQEERAQAARNQAEADRRVRAEQAARNRASRARQAKAETDARRAKAAQKETDRANARKAADRENARYRDEVTEITRKYRESLKEALEAHERTSKAIWDEIS